jgi:hypothetical protein
MNKRTLHPEVPAPTQDRIARRQRAKVPSKSRAQLAREFDELPDTGLATTSQLAAWLNCSEALLERRRWDGTGIAYIKMNRAVRYMKRVVVESVAGCSRTSTSEAV